MKLAFICGSLEPGRDGVGDYSRRLASALMSLGHDVFIIALNDCYLNETSIDKNIQDCDVHSVKFLRLPQSKPWAERIEIAKEVIHRHDPAWLSLQYVPYSFDQKGIPFRLPNRLTSLTMKHNWHIMFHELWENGTALKNRLVGKSQKWIARSLAKNLKAKCIHSSTTYNVQLLNKAHIVTTQLRLFGNVPIAGLSLSINTEKKDRHRIKGIYFGAAPNPEAQNIILKKLTEVTSKNNTQIDLILAGALGPNGKAFHSSLSQVKQIATSRTGFISEVEVSRLMQKSDFGISRSPAKHLGKSGSTISMLEHGLPVWCPLVDSNEELTVDLEKSEINLIHSSFNTLPTHRLPPVERLPIVASQLVANLENSIE